MKKFLLFVWIIGWTFVGFQQVPITLQSLNMSNNQKNWPPDGYVIVENRSGEKIMITEETDEKFNPKTQRFAVMILYQQLMQALKIIRCLFLTMTTQIFLE